jgi:pimeloyl-ACP methyl ester carboxylesterase
LDPFNPAHSSSHSPRNTLQPRVPQDHGVEAHAEFIGRALEELGIERAHLVMHDFGGPWGLAWAVSEPERLATATLICTGPVLRSHWHRLGRH